MPTTSESELNVDATNKQSGTTKSKCQGSQLTCYKQVWADFANIRGLSLKHVILTHARLFRDCTRDARRVYAINRRYIASDRIVNESERQFIAVYKRQYRRCVREIRTNLQA